MMGGEEPRDPIDFSGFSTEKDLPTGDGREDGLTDPEDLNCDEWAIVDFGHGPVDVRCTMTGEHDEHACQVIFVGDDEEESDPSMN